MVSRCGAQVDIGAGILQHCTSNKYDMFESCLSLSKIPTSQESEIVPSLQGHQQLDLIEEFPIPRGVLGTELWE